MPAINPLKLLHFHLFPSDSFHTMGCFETKIGSTVIEPTEVKSDPPANTTRTSSTSSSTRVMENFILVWFLPDSSPTVDAETRQLRRIISWLRIFSDWLDCVTYISHIRTEKVFLIVPTADLRLSSLVELPQLEKIYILDRSAASSDIFTDVESLCQELQTDVDICQRDLLQFVTSPAVSPTGTLAVDLKRQEVTFLYMQLLREVLFRLKFTADAQKEFISFFRAHYADDEEQSRAIDEFESTYRPQRALAWLTRSCFIWRVLQRIQRTPEIDVHYKVCFFVKHVYAQMNVFQENNSTLAERHWIVYRGKTMPAESFDLSMHNHAGSLLCLAGFAVAETDKQSAMDFVRRRLERHPHNVGLLFEMHVEAGVRSTRSPLASLEEVYSSEAEEKTGLLFSPYTVFRIESIEPLTGIHLVKLTLITDDDPQLLRLASPVRSSDVYTNPLSFMGRLFMEIGDYEKAEQYFLAMLQDSAVQSQPIRLARVHRGLGTNFMNKGDYGRALEHYRKALEASASCLSREQLDLVSLHDEIGNSYFKLGDYPNAVENYACAVDMLQRTKKPANEPFAVELQARLDAARKLLSKKPC